MTVKGSSGFPSSLLFDERFEGEMSTRDCSVGGNELFT